MKAIIFTDKQHPSRMITLIKQARKINESSQNVDIEYGTAAYLLSAKEDTYNKAKNFVSSNGIDFRKMMIKNDFSSGDKIMVKLAGNLFNGSYKAEVSPQSLIDVLDEENFKIALCAISMRFDGRLNLGNLIKQEK